ncbi:MAG TPA: rod shape-determining protein RodA, partial [Actinomycetota bacterium]
GRARLMADMVAGRVWVEQRRPIRHIDPTLLLVVAGLVIVGLFAIYSATSQTLRQDGLDPLSRVNKQLVTAVLGFVLLLLIATFDYRFLKVYAGFIFGATLVMLLLLQIPGVAGNASGTSNYINIPGVSLLQISPSEFAKIGLIVILSAMLSELRTPVPELQDFVRVLMVAGVTMGLVFINVEIGTTIVLMAITVGILVVAGTRAKHLITLALASLLLIGLAFQMNVIEDYQIARLTSFLDSENASEDARYNLEQSEIAVGSGGMFGQGYLHGTQTALDYVPEQHTDFIFTVIGEEFGFAGSVFVLSLFAVLLWRAIRIAFLSKDAFGTYLATGVASMFAVQMFVNVGMVIGIMPITGIPLPFLSYGGTAMLVNFLAVGILLNVHMRRFK